MDESYVPFEIVSLEGEDKYEHFIEIDSNQGKTRVKLRADIDRVDRKNGVVRVLDYKTGRDETEIGSFENLFSHKNDQKNRRGRKAGYQTFFYAWLYAAKYGDNVPIVPSLINIKQIFQTDFDYYLKIDNKPISDAGNYLPLFEQNTKKLLEEIFSPAQPFIQTEDRQKCIYCDYRGICER